MELNFGSNIISNTNGVLVIEGKNQIQIEMGDKCQPLLTMNLYNAKANHVAMISRNKLVLHENNLTITTAPRSFSLIAADPLECVIEINVVDGNIVQILQGRFYTHRGNLLEISPDGYSVEKMKIKHSIINAAGKAFVVC